MKGLMTVSEEEELEDTAPLGRLPLAHFDMGESDTNTDADLSADDVMSLISPRSTRCATTLHVKGQHDIFSFQQALLLNHAVPVSKRQGRVYERG